MTKIIILYGLFSLGIIFDLAGCPSFETGGVQQALDMQLVSNDTVNQWEKYEIAFKLPSLYENAVDSFFRHYFGKGKVNDKADLNPYADDSLEVRIDLISPYPSQKHITKWAFFMREAKWSGNSDFDTLMQDQSNPLDPYHWHFRFAPDTIGRWQFRIFVSTPKWESPLPTYSFGPYFFTAEPPLKDNHGYLKTKVNSRYLRFEDGTPFFGLGENFVGGQAHAGKHSNWPDKCDNHFYRLVYESFKKSFGEMHNAGANLVRNVFLRNSFAFDRNSLGVYDQFYNPLPVCYSPDYPCKSPSFESGNMQYHIRMLDSIVDNAHENQIYLVLLPDWGAPRGAGQSYNWGDNANVKYLYEKHRYSSIDSIGFDFYSDPLIRYYNKRSYKYLLSRWGYSVNIAMIQPIGEADGTYGYFGGKWIGTSNCSNTNQPMPFISGLRDSMNSWLNDVVGYIKSPIESGGLNDDKHLYLLTYLGLQKIDLANYGNFSNYYSLMNNRWIDINGTSSYWDNRDMMKSRIEQSETFQLAFPHKPFHFSEGSSFGRVDSIGKSIFANYNNYDVTFHNEIWAGAFMGVTNSVSTWNGEVVHRWKYSTRETMDSAFKMTVHDSSPPYLKKVIADKIKSAYHNFKPLSEFIANIDFDKDYIPCYYYGNTTDYIESYYLKTMDSALAYGWVHNINKYWANSFYWESGTHNKIVENFYGCDTMPKPASSYTISGFKHNHTYYAFFFKTRIGNQVLPATNTLTSDPAGNLVIDLSSSPLGCDSLNADYAFIITDKQDRMNDSRREPKPIYNPKK